MIAQQGARIHFKRVTRLCPQDMLTLAGMVQADVLGVETLELTASKTSLDMVVRSDAN
jgi:hypothetical protein